MALNRMHQTAMLPGYSNGLLLKDLLEWPQMKANRNESNFPAFNIKESEKWFEVEAVAPGLQKEFFSIEVENNLFSISYAQPEENKKEDDGSRFFLKEYNPRSFNRNFKLPENKIETDKIEAKYKDGILTVILPKKEEKQVKVKQIKIT